MCALALLKIIKGIRSRGCLQSAGGVVGVVCWLWSVFSFSSCSCSSCCSWCNDLCWGSCCCCPVVYSSSPSPSEPELESEIQIKTCKFKHFGSAGNSPQGEHIPKEYKWKLHLEKSNIYPEKRAQGIGNQNKICVKNPLINPTVRRSTYLTVAMENFGKRVPLLTWYSFVGMFVIPTGLGLTNWINMQIVKLLF